MARYTLDKRAAVGSIPTPRTTTIFFNHTSVAQLAVAVDSKSKGRKFDPSPVCQQTQQTRHATPYPFPNHGK